MQMSCLHVVRTYKILVDSINQLNNLIKSEIFNFGWLLEFLHLRTKWPCSCCPCIEFIYFYIHLLTKGALPWISFYHLSVYFRISLGVATKWHDKEPSSLDDSKAKADWHVVTPDVRGCGPKSPGAISRSQLPTGMSKTRRVHPSIEFLLFPCRLPARKKSQKKRRFSTRSNRKGTLTWVKKPKWCLLFQPLPFMIP